MNISCELINVAPSSFRINKKVAWAIPLLPQQVRRRGGIMGKPTGFLEYERETAKSSAAKRSASQNFKEFRTPLNKEKQKLQGARCMACGVPFCQSGMMIGGMASGCPLHNLVPETNDLVYTGNWKQAFLRLSKTHSFPEFTSRVCPALCEAACTCNINGEPVSTKETNVRSLRQPMRTDG